MSKAFRQGTFLQPPDRKHIVEQSVAAHEKKKRIRREANLYDAVAGRVSSKGFIKDEPYTSQTDAGSSTADIAVTPEEVLFRRGSSPQRTVEDDIYWAERHLLPSQTLPDPDLLKILHTFTADFYARATVNKGITDSRTMDETALLALGILTEESAAQVLGENGDLVFVQGEPIEEEQDGSVSSRSILGTLRGRTRSRSRSITSDREPKRQRIVLADQVGQL